MLRRFAVLRTSDRERAERWLADRAPDDVIAWPGLWLATWGGLERTRDGRGVGTLAGALTSDLDVAEALTTRGWTVDREDHRALAVTTVALQGPEGLARLRWQGSLAVAHLAQRAVLVARDVMGVGGLAIARLGPDGEVAVSDPGLLGLGQTSDPVPGTLSSLWTANGISWQKPRLHPDARPWLREVPDALRHANAAEIEAGLVDRIGSAAQALGRGLGGLTLDVPTEPCGHWLAERFAAQVTGGPGWWTLRGAESPFGRLEGPPEGWCAPVAEVKMPATEPPEPIDPVPGTEATQRHLRSLWLPDHVLAPVRAQAVAQRRVLVAPHLDVQALAWLGAVPEALRPRPGGLPG